MTEPTPRRRRRAIGPLTAALVVSLLLAIAWFGLEPALALLEWLEERVDRHFWPSLLAYTVVFTLLVLTTLPVGTVFCLAGGYLFGLGLGASAALLAATTGATLTLLLVRGLGGSALRNRLSRGRLEPWLRLLERDATWYLILLRIIPVMPFFLVNAAAGLTRIRRRHFVLATMIGLLPTSVIYAAIGRGLDEVLDAQDMAGPALLLEPQVAGPLLALAFIIAGAWLLHHRMAQRAARRRG